MKTTIKSRLVLAAASATALTLATLIPIAGLNLGAMIGGAAAAGILGVAWADYTRKPRFGMHAPHRIAPARPASVDALASWTYHTISA
jgi:hypothetical protein